LDAVLLNVMTGNHSSRSTAAMIRRAGTALVGTTVLAALAGCAYQESFGLPELTPQGASAGVQVYPGYGYGYGYGSGYGYPGSYQLGYGNVDPFYAGQGPYPYGSYRYPYNAYPRYVVVSCPDNNRDGRCDKSPPKDRDHHGNDGQGGNHDRDDRPVPPRYARGAVPDVEPDTRPENRQRARREVAPVAQPQAAPVAQQPARVRPEPRRATPPEGVTPRGPRNGRVPVSGDDTVPVRPTQEP
jgi:hypothetical protein